MNVAATVVDPTTATSDKPSAEQPAIGRSVLPFLVGAVLLLGLLPRLQQLEGISVWFDEAFSRKMTTFGFIEIWARTARDVHPPLYYWLLKVWTVAFGVSPVALRSMSVLFGLLTILGTFLLVREAGRGWKQRFAGIASQADTAALLAAAFVALSPFQIAWSLQARMYSLGTALAVLSSWLLLRALRSGPPRTADWIGYALLAIGLSYTHIFGLFTIAAQAMCALATALRRGWSTSGPGRWQTLGAVLLAFFAIEFCWLPWAGEFLAQRDRVAAGYWIPPFRWERVPEMAYQFFAVSEHDAPLSPILAWMATGFCGLLTVGLLLFGRSGHRLVAVGFGVPVVIALGVSVSMQNVLITHYFLFAHVFLLSGTAIVVSRIPTVPGRALGGAVLLLAASAVCLLHVERREERAAAPGLRAAMRHLDALRQPGEPVLIGNPMLHAAVLTHVGDRQEIFVVRRNYEFPHFQGTPVMRESEYLDAEQLATVHPERVWVVEGMHWNGGTWTVEMPGPWVSVQEARFPELYGSGCEIIVRRYERLDALPALLRERQQTNVPSIMPYDRFGIRHLIAASEQSRREP